MPNFDFAIRDGAFVVQDGAFTGDLVIEDFSQPIGGTENHDGTAGPWRGSASVVGTSSDSFRGEACAYRDDGGILRKWSFPGDGLEQYPEYGGGAPGTTIAMAVRPLSNYVGLSFGHVQWDGHDTDGYGCYHLLLDLDDYYDTFQVRRADSGGDTPVLTESSPGVPDDDWYIIAVILDGDGYGRHVCQLWGVDIGAPGTGERAEQLDEMVVDDTTYRGRGIGFLQAGEAYWDQLMDGLP